MRGQGGRRRVHASARPLHARARRYTCGPPNPLTLCLCRPPPPCPLFARNGVKVGSAITNTLVSYAPYSSFTIGQDAANPGDASQL